MNSLSSQSASGSATGIRRSRIRLGLGISGGLLVLVIVGADQTGLGDTGVGYIEAFGYIGGILLCVSGYLYNRAANWQLTLWATYLAVVVVFVVVGGLFTDLGWKFYLAKRTLFGERPIGVFQPDPVLGWSHIPGAIGRHVHFQFDVQYSIDEHGFRLLATPSEPNRHVLFLGGSYTFGHGVSDLQNIPALMATRHWPKSRVVNAAVNGWGTVQSYLKLKELIGLDPKASMVLYGWMSRHAERNYLSIRRLKNYHDQGYKSPYFDLDENGNLLLQGTSPEKSPMR